MGRIGSGSATNGPRGSRLIIPSGVLNPQISGVVFTQNEDTSAVVTRLIARVRTFLVVQKSSDFY